jgi:hypothetical protein
VAETKSAAKITNIAQVDPKGSGDWALGQTGRDPLSDSNDGFVLAQGLNWLTRCDHLMDLQAIEKAPFADLLSTPNRPGIAMRTKDPVIAAGSHKDSPNR